MLERPKIARPQRVKIPEEAKPFYFPAGNKTILFIHGFTDSLCRVNGFAKFMASQGVTTKGVLLPGHCQTWEELAKTTPDDWYQEVEHSILSLAKEKKDIYAVGISFGGNLALKFDAQHPGVLSGIVCIETPTRIKKQYLTKVAIPFASSFGMKVWDKKFLRSVDHPDKDKVFKQGVLDKMPLVNIKQIIDFLENKQKFLEKVTCDTFIVQSENSTLVPKSSASKIYNTISSGRKEIYWLDSAYHNWFLSEHKKRKIFYAACEFFGIEL